MKTWEQAMQTNNGSLDSRENYIGDDWFKDWLLVAGRSKNSSILEQSNFDFILNALDGESETVQIIRFGHWAVGWIEELMIAPNDAKLLAIVEELHERLRDYPVLDEMDYDDRKWNCANEVWNNCYNMRERIELCKQYELSIFAARHNYIPFGDDGSLFDYLMEEWDVK